MAGSRSEESVTNKQNKDYHTRLILSLVSKYFRSLLVCSAWEGLNFTYDPLGML